MAALCGPIESRGSEETTLRKLELSLCQKDTVYAMSVVIDVLFTSDANVSVWV
jgi:hypothetical protein